MTNKQPKRDAMDALFLDNRALIDVRAPVEFKKGAFPNAINLPILNDAERESVGRTYKESGQAAAIELGHSLVSGATKSARIDAWISHFEKHPDAALYCFRGGMRSSLACEWLAAAGYNINKIEGGYKALRNHLLGQFEKLPPLLIISGKTGAGKTEVISRFPAMIDLEGIANHRGSAFGGHLQPQPSQIDFENQLAIAFLKLRSSATKNSPIVLEDESRLIGRISLPPSLQTAMKQAPIMVLEESLETRAENIFQEYIVQQWQSYLSAHGASAAEAFGAYLLNAIDAIRKRLGGVAHSEIRQIMLDALERQTTRNDHSLHRLWIERLLQEYYDPMYEYQLSNKQERVVVCGRANELHDWYLGTDKDD